MLVVEDEDDYEAVVEDPISDRAQLLVMPRAGLTVLTNLYVPVGLRGLGLGRMMMRACVGGDVSGADAGVFDGAAVWDGADAE
jgi:hypothetical protein